MRAHHDGLRGDGAAAVAHTPQQVAVRDAELLAIKEINEAGGVLGHQIESVVEDGASDWPTFASKAEKLLTVDEVLARIEAVTLDDCRAIAAEVFSRPEVLAVVGPSGA